MISSTAKLKLIINAAENLGFETDETKTLESIYEDAYQVALVAAEDDESTERVPGEFINYHRSVYAQAKDGTEYTCSGQIVDENVKTGDIVGDFMDKSGKIVLVTFLEEE